MMDCKLKCGPFEKLMSEPPLFFKLSEQSLRLPPPMLPLAENWSFCLGSSPVASTQRLWILSDRNLCSISIPPGESQKEGSSEIWMEDLFVSRGLDMQTICAANDKCLFGLTVEGKLGVWDATDPNKPPKVEDRMVSSVAMDELGDYLIASKLSPPAGSSSQVRDPDSVFVFRVPGEASEPLELFSSLRGGETSRYATQITSAERAMSEVDVRVVGVAPGLSHEVVLATGTHALCAWDFSSKILRHVAGAWTKFTGEEVVEKKLEEEGCGAGAVFYNLKRVLGCTTEGQFIVVDSDGLMGDDRYRLASVNSYSGKTRNVNLVGPRVADFLQSNVDCLRFGQDRISLFHISENESDSRSILLRSVNLRDNLAEDNTGFDLSFFNWDSEPSIHSLSLLDRSSDEVKETLYVDFRLLNARSTSLSSICAKLGHVGEVEHTDEHSLKIFVEPPSCSDPDGIFWPDCLLGSAPADVCRGLTSQGVKGLFTYLSCGKAEGMLSWDICDAKDSVREAVRLVDLTYIADQLEMWHFKALAERGLCRLCRSSPLAALQALSLVGRCPSLSLTIERGAWFALRSGGWAQLCSEHGDLLGRLVRNDPALAKNILSLARVFHKPGVKNFRRRRDSDFSVRVEAVGRVGVREVSAGIEEDLDSDAFSDGESDDDHLS